MFQPPPGLCDFRPEAARLPGGLYGLAHSQGVLPRLFKAALNALFLELQVGYLSPDVGQPVVPALPLLLQVDLCLLLRTELGLEG